MTQKTPDPNDLRRLLAEERRLRDLSEARYREIVESRRYRVATALTDLARGLLRRPRADKERQPESIPTVTTPRRPVETAVIVDPFTFHCLAPELALVPLSRDDWLRTLERTSASVPAWLFVESCWRGPDASWRHEVSLAHLSAERSLERVVAWFRERGRPTVFWAKEDPSNFARFLPAAELFDAVFTTAEECVPLYREALGHDRVAVLPFAAQPAVHRPAPDPPDRPIAFAGSWMGEKYPARGRALEWLLEAAKPYGLDIWDRNASGPLAFPVRWRPWVRGARPYPEIIETIRRYKVALNVSSTPESTTMLPRRVFELLACGVCVVSTPVKGIEELLPELVTIVRTPAEARTAFEQLLDDDAHRAELAARGRAVILQGHTYEHRVDQVLAALRSWGLGVSEGARPG